PLLAASRRRLAGEPVVLRRREFLRLLALAAAAGAGLRPGSDEAQAAAELYDVPPFGNVSFLHLTDVHGQLLPAYFREPSMNLGSGQAPHLVGRSEEHTSELQSRVE